MSAFTADSRGTVTSVLSYLEHGICGGAFLSAMLLPFLWTLMNSFCFSAVIFDLTVSWKSALATLSESGTSRDFASFPA